MKNKKRFVITVIIFVALMVSAILSYRFLLERYSPKEDVVTKTEENRQKAPDFVVYNDSGIRVKLSDYIGKKIVINFWATWCGPCVSELPYFDEAYREYKDNVVIMMVNMTDGSRETVERAKAFVDKGGYKFPIFFDTEYSAANAYGVRSIPLTVFIDEGGYIFDTHVGGMSKDQLLTYIKKFI